MDLKLIKWMRHLKADFLKLPEQIFCCINSRYFSWQTATDNLVYSMKEYLVLTKLLNAFYLINNKTEPECEKNMFKWPDANYLVYLSVKK